MDCSVAPTVRSEAQGSPDHLAALIADARQFDDEFLPIILQAKQLAQEPCDDRILRPTDEVMKTYRALVLVREQRDTPGFSEAQLEAEVKLTIGTASGIKRVADWKTVSREGIDTNLLKVMQPDVYAAFARETSFHQFTLL